MTDWATVSSLATAGGTLVLAVATFASVRSAKRSAQASERALLAGLRPVVVPSRVGDPPEKVGFHDDRWFKVDGGRAAAEATDEAIYFVVPVRNVGTGLAVLDRWAVYAERYRDEDARDHLDEFRRLTRDIYVPAGGLGFWQGALRDPDDPLFAVMRECIENRGTITVDLLYGDHEGGQRTITRIAILPDAEKGWYATPTRHWNIDRSDPR